MDFKTYYSKLPPRKNKRGRKSRSWILYLVLGLAAVAVILKCSGIFGKEGNGETAETTKWEPISPEEVVKVTPDNSPDNPKFIKVSFTEDEYKNSPTYSEKIIRDSITVAEFKEQGVKVSIDSYNLHNAEDEVKVQVLPKKTDPTYGNELYTYNVSLASGQSKFGTDVEVALPIHNGKGAVRNVLWHNPETNEWEDVYHTIAEDGKTCTAYVDHFSEFAIEEMTIDDLKKMGKTLEEIYKKGSIFVEYENNSDDGRATYNIGLVPDEALEKIVRRHTPTAQSCFEILKAGGGVPANAGDAETLDLYGKGADIGATGDAFKLYDCLPKIFKNHLGDAFTVVGEIVLYLRVRDMILRGVNPELVIEENRWSFYSAVFGNCGLLAKGLKAKGLSTACGWACVLIFAGTTVYTIREGYASAIAPLGTPMDIEQGAYYQYLRIPNTAVLKKLGIKSNVPLTCTGQGWAEAIEAIFNANKNVTNPDELNAKIVELYNTYVDYFWSGNVDSKTKRDCWRSYLDLVTDEWTHYVNVNFIEPTPNLPSEEDEKVRLGNLYKTAESAKLKRSGALYAVPLSDKGFTKIWRDCRFDSAYVQARVKEYKHQAMEAITQNTNKIIYNLMEKEYRKNFLSVKGKLRSGVLPLMNTMLYFYAKDKSLKEKEPIQHSIYYGYDSISKKNDSTKLCKMQFKGNKSARFEANFKKPSSFCLWLKPNISNVKLGKCNVFHYLQYGAPDSVTIRPAKGIKLLKDLVGIANFKETQAYEIPTALEGVNERGFRIPIEFNGESEIHDLKAFSGFWLPEELMGKYTPSKWVLGLVYMEEENEFGEYEGPGESYGNENRWMEIKYFDFNKKTSVLTIDFEKNNPKKGQGTATFYVDNNDRLVMKNAGGTYRFIRFTEENRKKNDELYIEEQKRKAKEREKQQKQMKEDQKKYSIIPPGDED